MNYVAKDGKRRTAGESYVSCAAASLLLMIFILIGCMPCSALDWYTDRKFSSDGKRVLCGNDQDPDLRLLSVKARKVLWKYVSKCHRHYNQYFNEVVWSPDNKKVLVPDNDGIHALDINNGKTIGVYSGLDPENIFTPAWSSDGKLIACIGIKPEIQANTLVVWDTSSKRIVFDHNGFVASRVIWAPHSRKILFNNRDHTVQLWDVDTKTKLLSISIPAAGFPALLWSPDEEYFGTEAFGDVVIYDSKSGLPINEHQFDDDVLGEIAWAPDGKSIAYGDYNKPQTWNLPFKAGEIERIEFKQKLPRDKGYIPKNLDECFTQFNVELTPNSIQKLKNKTEDSLYTYHFELGMWIRNYWGLWNGSELAKSFHKLGIWHPDDMSGIIITSYWRHLNGKPLELEKQAQKYIDYWKQQKSKKS